MDTVWALAVAAAVARQSEQASVLEGAAAAEGATTCDGAVATPDCWAPATAAPPVILADSTFTSLSLARAAPLEATLEVSKVRCVGFGPAIRFTPVAAVADAARRGVIKSASVFCVRRLGDKWTG